jgi:hypothetical protein
MTGVENASETTMTVCHRSETAKLGVRHYWDLFESRSSLHRLTGESQTFPKNTGLEW